MGILDYYQDPQMMALLGISSGLLEAGGANRLPVSVGQGLGRGFLGGANLAQDTTRQNLVNSYLGEQMKQLQGSNLRQEQMAPILAHFAQRLQGGAQGAQQPMGNAMQPGHPGSSVMAGGPVGAPQQAQQGGGFPFSVNDLALLKMMGGPDLMSAYTASRPNVDVKDGVMFDKNSGSITNTIPTVNQQGFATQLKPDGRGGWSIGVTPGAEQAYGTQQQIGERAKAQYDPFLGQTDPQGRAIPQTRLQFATGTGSGQGMGPTPAVRQAVTTAATKDAERVTELEAKIPSLLSVGRRLDRMGELTRDDNTYAAASAELKSTLGSIAQTFGLSVNKAKTANTEEYLAHVAELLKDRLATKDYGSGTGVSNLDMLSAQKPLPELAKTAEGRLQLISALKADTQRNLKDAQAARDYFDANSGLRGFRYPSEVAAEKDQRVRDLPKEPGTPPSGGFQLPKGVTVRRIGG